MSCVILGSRSGARTQHLPVKHVAQGLVPDPRVHRRARLPSDQIGSIVEKVNIHQVKGAAETERGDSETRGGSLRSGCSLSTAVPARVPGVCGTRPGPGPQGVPVGRATFPQQLQADPGQDTPVYRAQET